MQDRQSRLEQFTKKIGCDVLVTFEPENLFYLTGFWGEAIGMLQDGAVYIIVPELEAKRAEEDSPESGIIVSQRGRPLISELAKRIGGKKACIDCQSHATMQSLKHVQNITHSAEPFANSRLIKDPGEVAVLRQASAIIDGMFELCTRKIRRGQSELELQSALMSYAHEHEMFATGYRYTLNPLIVAAGPNGALPHAQVTGRKFEGGDLIVVDLTLRYRGYVSDSTRTFALGAIPDDARRAYDIVRESQRLGLDAVGPGVTSKSVDEACRRYIAENDYGQYFVHSTGHGIGLDVHEPPSISPGSDAVLSENMAITVEPGIYVPGKFGVRIEDSLIVGKKTTVMHKFTKELITI